MVSAQLVFYMLTMLLTLGHFLLNHNKGQGVGIQVQNLEPRTQENK
jgi:hypothetical protein